MPNIDLSHLTLAQVIYVLAGVMFLGMCAGYVTRKIWDWIALRVRWGK